MREGNSSDKRKWYMQPLVWFLAVIFLIKIISLYPGGIELYYSTGIYSPIVSVMRLLIGWLPFSVGDILYTVAGSFLLWKLFGLIKRIAARKLDRAYCKDALTRIILTLMVVYVYFNIAWGLNYNRLGIAYQLKLHPKEYTVEDLRMITGLLLQRVNVNRKAFPDSVISIPTYSTIFNKSETAYANATAQYPWLRYTHQSIKRSLYGRMGNYLGFLGYYNPFTGEAQLNLTIPKFLIPSVTCHEMGHQLGYASESEASFVGYLAAIHSPDSLYHYSTYFDLFSYANRELAIRDSMAAKSNFSRLDSHVKGDFYQLHDYLQKTKNPLEPLIKIFYDQYLKANQQEKGMQSYNEVIGWLIAYKKKYGTI